jgi:quercetin dioxygenase-like cupin family protein
MALVIEPLWTMLNAERRLAMSALSVRIFKWVLILTGASLLNPIGVGQAQSATALPVAKPRAMVMFSHPLPKLDGAQLKTTVLEVNYGPGESSVPHSHPCAVIGYVTQGSIRSQVKGELQTILKTGESFYEAPNAVHLVSANASSTEPASFLAIFICDGDAPLSTDVSAGALPGGNK